MDILIRTHYSVNSFSTISLFLHFVLYASLVTSIHCLSILFVIDFNLFDKQFSPHLSLLFAWKLTFNFLVCNRKCPIDECPLCGYDQKTYSNLCEFQNNLCDNPNISVKHSGPCGKQFFCNFVYYYEREGEREGEKKRESEKESQKMRESQGEREGQRP